MKPAGTNWGLTSATIFAIVVGLAAVDQFLARVESAEVRNTAQRSYLTGSRLLQDGKPGEAIDSLREAHSLDRQNGDYELQLVEALTAAGNIAAAEPPLTEVLLREPNDGRANLIAARVMTRNGNAAEAEAYYHRAIYGEWSRDPNGHRVSARMELIEMLAAKNQKQELLAELISLEAESPTSGEIQKRLGELFLVANAPARAATVYRAMVAKSPGSIPAYEGLGEAELEQGQYGPAREAFLRASLLDAGSESVRAHLQTLNTVTGLDPTLRQLTSAEKYRRSIRILEMTSAALDQCVSKDPSRNSVLHSEENQQLLNAAKTTTAGKMPAHVTNEIAEGVLSLAERLWRVEATACGSGSPDQDALSLVMKKLTS